jgi:hypothetical protein
MDGVFVDGTVPITIMAASTTSVVIALKDPPEFQRELVLSGSLYIHDSEPWPFSDDNKTYAVYYDGIFLGPFGTHAQQYHEQRHGGEIRVEVQVTADWKFPGNIVGNVHVKFFEGISEHTDDLEDEKEVPFQVAKGETTTVRVNLKNTEFGGGDTADLKLDISNKMRP